MDPLKEIADATGGTIKEVGSLPDGSSFATLSMPLPDGHWLLKPGFNVPPMPFRMGQDHLLGFAVIEKRATPSQPVVAAMTTISRSEFAKAIRAAGQYAVRCATRNGADSDFDPDALLQNLVVGFLGYWTEIGLDADDDFANPKQPYLFTEEF